MDRTDYWLLANAIATQPNNDAKYGLVLELCRILRADNGKFDPEKFIEACEG
jgi:hypothetical protein